MCGINADESHCPQQHYATHRADIRNIFSQKIQISAFLITDPCRSPEVINYPMRRRAGKYSLIHCHTKRLMAPLRICQRYRTGTIVIAIKISGKRLRSEEHTSELQSLMRISYAVFCLKKKKTSQKRIHIQR